MLQPIVPETAMTVKRMKQNGFIDRAPKVQNGLVCRLFMAVSRLVQGLPEPSFCWIKLVGFDFCDVVIGWLCRPREPKLFPVQVAGPDDGFGSAG